MGFGKTYLADKSVCITFYLAPEAGRSPFEVAQEEDSLRVAQMGRLLNSTQEPLHDLPDFPAEYHRE